jgi:hypothetical protein
VWSTQIDRQTRVKAQEKWGLVHVVRVGPRATYILDIIFYPRIFKTEVQIRADQRGPELTIWASPKIWGMLQQRRFEIESKPSTRGN